MRRAHIAILLAVSLGGWALETARAGTGGDAWLRYAPLESTVRAKYESLLSNVVLLGDSVVLRSAQGEMIRGITAMTGRAPDAEKNFQKKAIILGTLDEIHAVLPKL